MIIIIMIMLMMKIMMIIIIIIIMIIMIIIIILIIITIMIIRMIIRIILIMIMKNDINFIGDTNKDYFYNNKMRYLWTIDLLSQKRRYDVPITAQLRWCGSNYQVNTDSLNLDRNIIPQSPGPALLVGKHKLCHFKRGKGLVPGTSGWRGASTGSLLASIESVTYWRRRWCWK